MYGRTKFRLQTDGQTDGGKGRCPGDRYIPETIGRRKIEFVACEDCNCKTKVVKTRFVFASK